MKALLENKKIEKSDLKKSESKRHSSINDNSEDEGSESENIRPKVKALLDNKKQLSLSEDGQFNYYRSQCFFTILFQ